MGMDETVRATDDITGQQLRQRTGITGTEYCYFKWIQLPFCLLCNILGFAFENCKSGSSFYKRHKIGIL